jgi:hypothetical protein
MDDDVLGLRHLTVLPALDWLRQFFIDTYSTDWCTNYQLELIGEVPDAVLRWADTERLMVCHACREVSDGQYFVTMPDGFDYCEECTP